MLYLREAQGSCRYAVRVPSVPYVPRTVAPQVTAARLEGLLMAACAAPVDGGLHGSMELPSAAPAPHSHPTDVVASSSPVRESER